MSFACRDKFELWLASTFRLGHPTKIMEIISPRITTGLGEALDLKGGMWENLEVLIMGLGQEKELLEILGKEQLTSECFRATRRRF